MKTWTISSVGSTPLRVVHQLQIQRWQNWSCNMHVLRTYARWGVSSCECESCQSTSLPKAVAIARALVSLYGRYFKTILVAGLDGGPPSAVRRSAPELAVSATCSSMTRRRSSSSHLLKVQTLIINYQPNKQLQSINVFNINNFF